MLSDADKQRVVRHLGSEGAKELTLRRAEAIAAETNVPLRAVEWAALDSGIIPLRYQRHMGCVSVAGQKKLLESTVTVIGLGGLGGHVVEQLARAGVGRIIGVDPDVFDETNLNRQLLSSPGNLGEKKTDQARERLESVNRAVEFTAHAVPLADLSADVFQQADLAVDCLDNIENRLALAEACSRAKIPLVHGAIAGWYGQVGVIWPGSGMLERVLHKRQGRGIEQGLGNPPFTAAVAASLMAAEVVKVLTRSDEPRRQALLFFDLLANEWQTLDLP